MPDNTVESYGWEQADGPESCGYIAPRIVKILQSLNAKRVVDIGAGNGALCRLLTKSGMTPVGIEYDARGVEIARQALPTVRFYQAGVQDDPIPIIQAEGQFEVAVSTEVIEHLFSPHLLPQFAARLLAPGGRLVITTPYHGYLKNLALSVAGKWDKHHTALWHGGHIKFWSRSTLTSLLERNGFKVIGFEGVGRFPYLWKSMVIVAEKVL